MAGAEQRKARDSMKKGVFQLEYSFSKNTIYTKFTPSHLQTIVLTTYLGARDRNRTGTFVLGTTDFKSVVSTNSTTRANGH